MLVPFSFFGFLEVFQLLCDLGILNKKTCFDKIIKEKTCTCFLCKDKSLQNHI